MADGKKTAQVVDDSNKPSTIPNKLSKKPVHESALRAPALTLCMTLMILGVAITIACIYLPLELIPTNLQGKTYLVTGCALGSVELETAKLLLEWNATVICTVPDQQRLDQIKQSPSAPHGLELDILQFAELSSVRSFAKQFIQTNRILDGIVIGSGVSSSELQVTSDGFDEMYQINHLAPFLLVRSLETLINEKARIVYLSSSEYFFRGRLIHKSYSGKPGRRIGSNEAETISMTYVDTKLMQVLTANEMSRRFNAKYPNKSVTFNSVCPGVVGPLPPIQSWKSFTGMAKSTLRSLLERTPREGAIRGIMILTMPRYANVSAMFFPSYVFHPFSQYVKPLHQGWLYNTSVDLLEITA